MKLSLLSSWGQNELTEDSFPLSQHEQMEQFELKCNEGDTQRTENGNCEIENFLIESNSVYTPCEMPRRTQFTIDEAAPLKNSILNRLEDEDVGYDGSSIDYGRHTRSLQWAIFFGAIALSCLILLGVVSVVLTRGATTKVINIDNGTLSDQQLLKLSLPLLDVRDMTIQEMKNDILNFDPNDPYHDGGLYKKKRKLTNAEMEEALSHGRETLNKRREIEKELLRAKQVPPKNSPYNIHQHVFRKTSPESRTIADAGYALTSASVYVVRNFNFTPSNGFLVDDGSFAKTADSDFCFPLPQINCSREDPYRTVDGSCNNLNHIFWGSVNSLYRRIIRPDYDDGMNSPRTIGVDGIPLPNARYVSLVVHNDESVVNNNEDVARSLWFPIWGQFIDHDITATGASAGPNGTTINCCNRETGKLVSPQHPECFPILLSQEEDKFYSQYGRECLDIFRSGAASMRENSQCQLGPREQFNQITTFIDGSTIYSSSKLELYKLRAAGAGPGRIRTFVSPDGRPLLATLTNPADVCNRDEEVEKRHFCFVSGDDRVNENIGLTSLHLLFTRNHNVIASGLAALNPHWDDEIVFQEAKRINVAIIQHITYGEFLSSLFGSDRAKSFNLLPMSSGHFEGYDRKLNPGISNAFATAAYRFGHSMIPSLVKLLGPHGKNQQYVQSHKLQFNPFSLWDQGGLEYILRGHASQAAAPSDTIISKQLTEHLFQRRENKFGFDLAAVNIQRGRDHGIPGYSAWRAKCGFSIPNNFNDLEGIWNAKSLFTISTIYKVPADVDLYTGGLAEITEEGSVIGPTFTCIIADQFHRLKFGDRFFYEGNKQPKPFSELQLQEIRKMTLARILCDNSDSLRGIQLNVMLKPSDQNPLQDCFSDEIPKMSLRAWEEKETKEEEKMKKDSLENDLQDFNDEDPIFIDAHRNTTNEGQTTVKGNVEFEETKKDGIIIKWKLNGTEKESRQII